MQMQFVIPCLLGVESLITKELEPLGATDIRAENGRVLFAGDETVLARVNICSRFAERVQILVGTFSAHSFDELFDAAKALPWEQWIGALDAFPVKGYSLESKLFSIRDCQAIIKKAVVERLKGHYGLQWFEESGPVHQIQFSVRHDTVSLLLDTTGAGLHKRGYRLQANEAPIKETLAAALCAISQLRPYHSLYDPLCGSGTILIEGAMMARNIAPGKRRNFAAERWEQLPREIWQQAREWATAQERETPDFAAFGSDIDAEALAHAKENAKRAGVADCIQWQKKDLADFAPQTERGTLICNPPYGERLLDQKQAQALTRLMGQKFPQQRGWSYSIISPDKGFEAAFGRKADKRRKLYNGMIPCTVYMYYK